jgi:hypothetical protein
MRLFWQLRRGLTGLPLGNEDEGESGCRNSKRRWSMQQYIEQLAALKVDLFD